MHHVPLRSTVGAATATALTLTLAACGGGGGGNITDPPGGNPTPGPTPGTPSEGPPPQGAVVYALDNGNYLLMFGTESGETISPKVKISGLPILKRMIGIDFRPSNGKSYGVGNDSRVYVIDTLSGAATPVNSEPFTPSIISSFDIHFGMNFDPIMDRIRLISNELGGNWSINPDNGTAVMGKTPRYADGDVNAGKKPSIGGLTYMPAPVAAANHLMSLRTAQFSAAGPCEQLMVAMDTELSQLISSCDPDNGDFTTLGPIPGITSLACVEIDYEGPGGGIWAVGQRINDGFNSIGTVDPKTGTIDWKVRVPDNWLIQQITFKPKDDGIGNMVAPYRPHFSVASGTLPGEDESGVDPVALCRGEG